MSRRLTNIIQVSSSWTEHTHLSTLKALDSAIESALTAGRAHHQCEVGKHTAVTVRRLVDLEDGSGYEYRDEYFAGETLAKATPRFIRTSLREFCTVTLHWNLPNPVHGTSVVHVTLRNSYIHQ